MIIFYLVIINAAGFLLMLSDKEKAKKKLWRIPEAVLLGIAAAGGSLGILAGMRLGHHKTKHLRFSIGVPVLLAIHLIIAVFFL